MLIEIWDLRPHTYMLAYVMSWFRDGCASANRISCSSVYTVSDRVLFFFFQAEDGIRDVAVTGVQTCALPILARVADGVVAGAQARCRSGQRLDPAGEPLGQEHRARAVGAGGDHRELSRAEIGRASCRERV